MNQSVKTQKTPKPKNPQKVKEAITLGKKLSKTADITKVAINELVDRMSIFNCNVSA